MPPLRLAVIGCGAIGSAVLRHLATEPSVRVAAVVLRDPASPTGGIARTLAPGAHVLARLDDAPAPVDLVLECAGHDALAAHVLPALARGVDCIVTSIGALGDAELALRLEQAGHDGGSQLELVSGAIGAIDALAAARLGGLERVTYVGRKPPSAWQGTPAAALHALEDLDRPLCIFEGSAREAARLYPRNANVAATVSLAGLGLDRTQVQLYADPHAGGNVHELQAEGAFGSLVLTLRGQPLASNPKTSALTVYSALRAVLNRRAAWRI